MTASLSEFAESLTVETAFDVLAVAKGLKAKGKDVVELQIGDSPFPSTLHAKSAGINAVQGDQSHYCASSGLPEFRQAVVDRMKREYDISLTIDNVVAGPGAKVFEQYFCETFLNPGDEVLVFGPQFPTYLPNILRRRAVMKTSILKQENHFRPSVADVEKFASSGSKARAIFLNSPHNPTGGVATKEDIDGICDVIQGKNIALFSDEPYDHMVWSGKHYSPLARPEMLEQCVGAFTFSKSYSMSGWRLGYAISSPRIITTIAKLINTSVSCVPPIVQLAGASALREDSKERDEVMQKFKRKVELLTDSLHKVSGVKVVKPAGTFYVFPNVAPICNRHKISSHGLAMYLLEGADDQFGVACLGGECFGEHGHGFLRFSCAEPDDRLVKAIEFLPEAFSRNDRVAKYLESHPNYRRAQPYPEPA